MYRLQGKKLLYEIDAAGCCKSVISSFNGYETIETPGAIWKVIYAVPGTERVEAAVWADEQTPEITCTENEITLYYHQLTAEKGTVINAQLTIHLQMGEDGLRAWAEIVNNDPAVEIMEVQLTPLSGMRSLSGDPENDFITWPNNMGRKVRNPAYSDLSTYAGFRKYERHDQFHTDMDALYQDQRACMQWYDWYNNQCGIYVGSQDKTRSALCLHVERDTKLNVLRFGFIYYPMIKAGERFATAPSVYLPHEGDWHAGARIYRKWMDDEKQFIAPKISAWAQDFPGWLRVILKQHHCECNWTFDDIPRLYDECEAAGLNTLYLLGWETGGFARMWPDFEIDEGSLGGSAKLKEGIDYVHQKGGKVLMFLSYLLIDYQSKFYREQGGDKCTVKSFWQQDVPFPETYCGEGTYRKIGAPPMPMYHACPSSDLWHEKMKDAARVCLKAGADGVLYDLGGKPPFFCYSKEHGHDKPTDAYACKADRFADLRRFVKTYGEDKIILMEHNVDIFGQSMDVVQSSNTTPDPRLIKPASAANWEAAKDDFKMLEVYRYTFPELVLTNRECGEDENHYLANIGYSFVLGLRFDMTIFRCCGSLSDIPNYAAYLREITALYSEYADYILRGRFVDTDGFTWNDPAVIVKGYVVKDGTMAAALWNPTADDREVEITRDGVVTKICVKAERVAITRI